MISYFYGYKDRPHLVSHVHSSLGVANKLYYDDRDRDRERSLEMRSMIIMDQIPDRMILDCVVGIDTNLWFCLLYVQYLLHAWHVLSNLGK